RAARRAAPLLDGLGLAEAGLRERSEDVLAARALVVPGELHLAHQVRDCLLEAVVPLQRACEAADAALAADAADLNRLGARHGFDPSVRSATSATTASRLRPRRTSSWRSPSQRLGSSACNSSSLPSSRAAGETSSSSSCPSSAAVAVRSPSGWISSARGPKRSAAQRFCA